MDVASLIVKVQTQGVEAAQRELDKLGKNASNAEKSVGGLASSMKTLGALASVGAMATLAKDAIKMGDEWTNINSKLNLVTKTTIEFNKAQADLFSISQNTRTSLSTTVDLYKKLAVSTESLNISQSRLLKVTETINKAGIVGGGSKESINAALIQLGQGLASGALRGEELNSVLEQTPRLAKLIADGMGVQVGALKSLAEAGKITSQTVIDATEKGAKGIDKEFNVIATTISSATEVIENSMIKVVGNMDDATGATRSLSSAMIEMSKSINQNNTDIVATGQFIYATISRTADVFNLLYESVENTGQLVIGHINLLAYGSLEVILTMLTKVTEGLNVLGIASDKGLKEAYSDLEYIKGLVANANNLITDSYKDLDDAVKKLSPTIEDRIKQYNAENKAIADKLALQKKELEQGKTTGKSKQEVEAELKLEKEKAEITKKAQKDAIKLSEEWAKRKVEILKENSISEQDELAKPFILLTYEYQKDLEEFKGVMGAKEILAENFNKKYQRLGLDATAKIEEESQKDKQKDIQKELKLQEENFRIQARQVDLLDDEADRQVALATLERQRTQASLKAQMELGEVTPQYYDAMMEMEDKLLEKQKQNWTLAGQVVNNVTSQMESSMTDFLDATSDNFADFGKMATSILQEVYREIIRISVVKPLVSSLVGFGMDMFSGGASVSAPTASTYDINTGGSFTNAYFQPNAKGGAYSSPSLSQYSNQIVDKPTFFAFASGGAPNMGVMGEAGSEAILPLSRTSNGDLGVKAEGMGLNQVKIQIINESGTQMEVTKTSQTSDVEGMVIQAWISGISKNRYGSRQLLQGS